MLIPQITNRTWHVNLTTHTHTIIGTSVKEGRISGRLVVDGSMRTIAMVDKTQRIEVDADRVRRLLLSLDGVRYSCAIADMCHKRALRKLRTFEEHPTAGPAEADVIEVVADVWSIVDAAHRIRLLLRSSP